MQQSFGADSINIIQGSSRDLKVLLRYPSGEAFDLEEVTEVKALFPGAPVVTITMAATEIEIMEPKSKGAMLLKLSSDKTKLLNADERQTFEVEIKTAARTHIVQFKDMLDVSKRLK